MKQHIYNKLIALVKKANKEGVITYGQGKRTIQYAKEGHLDDCRIYFEGSDYEDDYEEVLELLEAECENMTLNVFINYYN